MQEASNRPNDLQKELDYYKSRVSELSGESIRFDYLLSSLRYELKQRKDGFSLLTQLQEKFTIDTPVGELYSETLKGINTYLGMDRSVLLTLDPTTNIFKTVFNNGYPADQVKTIEQTSIDLPPDVLQGNSSLLQNNSIEPDVLAMAIREKFLINFFIGVPVFHDNKPIAFLVAGRLYEKVPFNHPLNKGDVDTLIAIASLMESVFQNKHVAELRHEMQKQKDENEEITRMLAELKATQNQLIHAEKMASLGELTAGIAHEIQNPLNFVNNFSEINQELLAELKDELQKGNSEEVIQLADNVIENENKIKHHGKRADSIVKSMLQHSRTSSGQKELVDINALAEEYLRLAYHGMRAKDKFFNAELKTNLDISVGKISAIPQELGRVILNLLNNAFQAVLEKSRKEKKSGYIPKVSVETKQARNVVILRVIDNGTGILSKNIDKIFQPFFTTKATGEGTGLGLSMSYDIITKSHGGEIRVISQEGDGTEFIVELPVTVD